MARHKFKLGMQIFLLIGSIFAFAYIMNDITEQIPKVEYKENKLGWKNILKVLVGMIFSERSIVSALTSDDLQKGVYTCIKGKDGSICQEYPASECDSKCNGECLPTSRDNINECKIGTCVDGDSGVCQERSSKGACELDGGKWFDDASGNIAECKKACCVVGENVIPLITSRECLKLKETTGINVQYMPEIKNEISCLALSKTKVEGACVFGEGDEKSCKFLTKEECLTNVGSFYEGLLCTHPDFGLNYQKQSSAKCVEGKDKIYWFDSEGNRENIYDANKARSWNNGYILPETQSCEIGSNSDNMANQKTCGNCDRLSGSVCGEKTNSERLSDNSINAVCKDMRCVDSNGNKRENGESWCEYQGSIGLKDGAGKDRRSVDTPGSRHFRASCIDGEIQLNSCADYRNEICIEEKNKLNDGGDISSAACITNTWQLCLNYNSELSGKEKSEIKEATEKRNEKCEANPVCFLKKVDPADNFKFDLCVPRYPPGFDLDKNAEGGELSCAFANQKCTVLYVKKISGWDIEVNEGCLKEGFAQQMNDLCMSLGDCGAKVNYNGDLTKNYKTHNTKKLDNNYLEEITKYSEPARGEYAKINITEYIESVGGLAKIGGMFEDPTPEELSIGGTISGLSGSVLLFAAKTNVASSTYLTGGSSSLAAPGSSVSLAGVAGVLAGAAIGFAVTSLLLQYTGVSAGLDPAITWTLVAAGTVGGALLGAAFAGIGGIGAGSSGLAAVFSTALIPVIGWIILVVVILVIVIFKAIGVGDTKKKIVEFQCQVWQAPLGGEKCSECGEDGYPCSKYSCQSLGQSCRLINEGSAEEKCVDINPGDVSSPIISPWKEVITPGYEYAEENGNGFKVKSGEEDGCIGSYQNMIFGISLNEPGYCRYDVSSKNNFEEMEFDFGSRNLFLTNHTQFFTMPDLSSLGLPGYDPTRRADLNLHVRCIDSRGNGDESKEYLINLCVKPGEDKTPPIVTSRTPINEVVSYGKDSLDAVIYTNEPSECKWSKNDNDYANMENNMECENDIEDRESLFGWKCGSTFNIDSNEETFYVRCKDQPWNAENESRRNVMTNSYEFKVRRTTNPLIINYVKPVNESLVFGVEPASVNVELETSGGIDGRARCDILGVPMGKTFGKIHNQIFDRIYRGEYLLPIICEDSVGNKAEINASFKAEVDSSPPIVTRVYRQGGNLLVVTNENSECSFVKADDGQCNFEFVNGTSMSGSEKVHETLFNNGEFYVKCKDQWENIPGQCNVKIRGSHYEFKG